MTSESSGKKIGPALIAVSLFISPLQLDSQSLSRPITVDVRRTLDSLIYDEDTDRDFRITVNDRRIPGTERGDRRFWITSVGNLRFEVTGMYFLSNLLQELTLADTSDTATINPERIFEKPADRISRQIRELFWDGLTRRIDEQGLGAIVVDEKTKTASGISYVYVPSQDTSASAYFREVCDRHPDWKLRVVLLPRNVTAEYVKNLALRHGLLTLSLKKNSKGSYEAEPFVVPGGRFNEMYGWDSYFIVLGLLHDGRVGLAKSVVDNFIYEIDHYGSVLNANRTYYLTRSQPPFLTSMASAVYEQLPRDSTSREWMRSVLRAAICEYRNVWMNPDRLTSTGLSRYFDFGSGPPPEVEAGHFDSVFRRYARLRGMSVREFEKAYRQGKICVQDLDEYFVHDRCMRESGHDTSNRLEGRCADLVTVDLNSLLFKIEKDISKIIREEFSGAILIGDQRETASEWEARAEGRKRLINLYLWDAQRGMFFDYNIRKGLHTGYVSPTTFFPLWAGLATDEQAALVIGRALPMLEAAGGVAGSSEKSRGPVTQERPQRQWDYPYGWAPHQIIVWRALTNYGYESFAQRLMYKWLYTITLNASQYNGVVPEKFNVVTRSHEVFAEYGNVGTKFSYITREGFGWTNASFQIAYTQLPPVLREDLNHLIAPERHK